MKKLLIDGGKELKGKITISGAKNAALPILMASLLVDGESTISNVPAVTDIVTTVELLTHLGSRVEVSNSTVDGRKLFRVDSSKIRTLEAPYEIVSRMRASFWVLGSLLGRYGEAKVSLPGGCAIGPRPCDIYMEALEKMQVDIKMTNGYVIAKAQAKNKKLKGADIALRLPSVGATHNTIMAAVLAEGKTVIHNAAREPEVVDLCNYLINAGARIGGMGTSTVEIEGVESLHSSEYRVIGDRMEAFSYMVAAAITRGDITLEGLDFKNTLGRPMEILDAMNLNFELLGKDKLRVHYGRSLKSMDVSTEVYPGFPTDAQAPLMALLAITEGKSLIRENIFENRFMHVSELNRLGANIVTDGNRATIDGVKKYSGAAVMASDLRAGMSLILAGLRARGQTVVDRIYHVERGYENFVDKLRACGANMEIIDDREDLLAVC